MAALKLNQTSLDIGGKLAAMFESCTKRRVKSNDVALGLSGGIDSTIVGMSMQQAGKNVHAYTFQLGDQQSFDTKHASNTAHVMGWSWTRINLPTDLRAVMAAWPLLYRKFDCRKKSDFECAWPFLFVYPAVQEKFFAHGLSADAYFGLSRKAFKAGAAGKDADAAIFHKWREDHIGQYVGKGRAALGIEYTASCAYQHRLMQDAYNITDVNPFIQRDVYKLLMDYSWQELNMPRQKHVLAGMYPTWMTKVGHRNHLNYQLVAGIDHHFERLLKTPLNFRKRSRVIDMMGDYRNYPDEVAALLERIDSHYGRIDSLQNFYARYGRGTATIVYKGTHI